MGSNFLIIGFTTPDSFSSPQEEGDSIAEFLTANAVDFFHIRKKNTQDSYVRELLNHIGPEFYSRLVLHSHQTLWPEFKTGGLHLNSAVDSLKISSFSKESDNLFFTKGIHALNELDKMPFKGWSYCFISPVFDSISKKGYKAAVDLDDNKLKSTNAEHKMIALGGVTPDNFKKLYDLKFAGAALLGYLWSQKISNKLKIQLLKNAREDFRYTKVPSTI